MEKNVELDKSIYWERKADTIRETYANLIKGEKSRLLSYLNRTYDLIPATMVAKFSGRNKFKSTEIEVICMAINKLHYGTIEI
jgi:CheY-specific phosphatase CheX